ncbi:MAG: hypothetical protein LLF28_01145 [Nitrospiraceae bacterium]|nr:hypothetical protein [Nitrospiraceae bacterium]
MALDDAISTCVRKGSSPPTLRLYSWNIPSVSIGHFQRTDGININYCRDVGIPIVRRPTGGRAILHFKEMTYSFSSKTDNHLFSKGLFDTYQKISSAFYLAFTGIGLLPEIRTDKEILQRGNPLCFQSVSYAEMRINNKKIIGSAQKRWGDGFLQQGSIPYILDFSKMQNIFATASIQNITDTMIGLKDIIPDLDDSRFRNIVKTSFEEIFNVGLVISLPSEEETALALELETEKYQTLAG